MVAGVPEDELKEEKGVETLVEVKEEREVASSAEGGDSLRPCD